VKNSRSDERHAEAVPWPPLPATFYDRDPATVARELLGAFLIRVTREGRQRGRIVETEAYLAANDTACHAARGRTRKNASMFAGPGTAYVYAIHSRWCFNVVTEPRGTPSAVLIRAIEPLEGIAVMEARRRLSRTLDLARGPARCCEALAIDRRLDGWSLCRGQRLWIAAGDRPSEPLLCSPRIGVTAAAELPLRFFLGECPYVSGTGRWNRAAVPFPPLEN
jgi:DNA-3-methyladenine glycosylase